MRQSRNTLVTTMIVAALALLVHDPFPSLALTSEGRGEEDAAEAPNRIQHDLRSLRLAIEDLIATYGTDYPQGRDFLTRVERLDPGILCGESASLAKFKSLRREALLANPLLDFDRLLVIRRGDGSGPTVKNRKDNKRGPHTGLEIGLPSNHECNSSLRRVGYDNEIAVLSPRKPDAPLRTLFRPDDSGYCGELDVHWDGDRMLFTRSDATNWKVWEMQTDGSGLRQVSRMPDDVDSFDACYLPDGRIVFGSTATFQSVPCWHGQKRVTNLYLMNADGSGARQLCFDQDHDLHPAVLPNGQVIYSRWDYTGICHIFLRELMVMNPDGTGQRAVYGSNSWFPNALYFPRAVPSDSGRLACILSGYHGVHRMGQLVVLDTRRGWAEAEGIIHRISGCGDPVRPMIRDNLVDDDWPKFLHPWPLSDKYFLVAARPAPRSSWGIYLADVFDNLLLLREEAGSALLEPMPLRKLPRPPVLPDRVDLARHDAVIHLHNVYAGPGLRGVPRGTIKNLRVVAYHFGYVGMAGPDKIGYGGPWEAMRILGTVPVEADGSALFRVPANTPLAVQALDAEGKAVQLMRSWYTAMPGESATCVGCHEQPRDTPTSRADLALRRPPMDIAPWYGPARGFDFEREVQPVLDRHCITCHSGQQTAALPDLRSRRERPDYAGRRVSQMEIDRMHPKMRADTQGFLKYTPAYDALIASIRRVGVEDDVSLLVPGEYHADTSPLIQMLRKGHGGVQLDVESWDRLVTWIDINGPCHGTWGEVYPIPDGAHQRRMTLRREFGGPEDDPEARPNAPIAVPRQAPDAKPETGRATANREPSETRPVADVAFRISDFPGGPREKLIDLGDGVQLKLVRIPAGEFTMGEPEGEPDERPVSRVTISKPFWMAECEISNQQFRRFDPDHDSRYYQKRYPALQPGAPNWIGPDARGLTLNDDRQPAVRVSWEQAKTFCRWLTARTGQHFDLPTESQWEWACRAGTRTPLSFGRGDADFSAWANVADSSFSKGLEKGGKQITGGLEHLMLEGATLSDARFKDGSVVTAEIGRFQPNAWGLHDLHGNVAEWTRTTYAAYPYRDDDGRNDALPGSRKVVRGGSYFDPPARCRSAFRLAYPSWQRVFNVGFRVICHPSEPGS